MLGLLVTAVEDNIAALARVDVQERLLSGIFVFGIWDSVEHDESEQTKRLK